MKKVQYINPNQIKIVRQMRRDMKQIAKTDYAKKDPVFVDSVRDFVRRIPDDLESVEPWDKFYTEVSNEFARLHEWSNRLFGEWLKKGTKIKEEKSEESAEMKKVTNKDGKGKLSFRGGRRPGAGRKRIGTTRTIKLTLPDDLWRIIDREPSPSEAIRKILQYHYPDPQKALEILAGNVIKQAEHK